MQIARATITPVEVHGSTRMPEAPCFNDDQAGEPVPDTSVADFADVSHYEDNIDWDKYASSGRKAAICKTTESTDWTDPKFREYRDAIGKHDLYCGLYHFAGASQAHHIDDPLKEANFFCDTIGPLGPKEFPVLDFEMTYKLTPKQQVDWVGKWCVQVEKRTGKVPWVYTGSGLLGNWDASSLTRYPLWVANYNLGSDPKNAPPSGSWPKLSAWQYTEKARQIPGMPTVDDSYLYADISTLVIPSPQTKT